MCVVGLGPVLVPLSSVIAGASGVLPPHITAALQSLAPSLSNPPQYANPLPSAPIFQAGTAGNLLQQLAASQMLQQAAPLVPLAPASQAAPASGLATAVVSRLSGAAPAGALAALVPHRPQIAPPVAHATAASASAAQSQMTAPSAGAPLQPELHHTVVHVIAVLTQQTLSHQAGCRLGVTRA